jgi:hypothetical protein
MRGVVGVLVARAALGIAVACLLGGMAAPARASMALLLEQPYGGLGHVNPTGHSAIYLSQVCAATPLELRPCEPGELGVVISRYDGIGHYDWLAIPLLPYLYAVDSPAEIPQTVDKAKEDRLRDAYRRRYLESIAPDAADGKAPDGNWYELVGSAYDRTTYGFSVTTTPEQDAELIAIFNDRRNVERYNGAFRNCADFARVTINRLYPHAVRRNFIADFGLTTPKSVARALTHYARKHPQMGLQVFVIPQVEGSLPRSHAAEGVTEGLIKRYSIPLVVLSPVATAIVFVAYMGHGRFDLPRDPLVLDLRDPATDTELLETAESPPAQYESPEAPEAPAVERIPLTAPLPAPAAAPPLSQPDDSGPGLFNPSASSELTGPLTAK